MERRAKLAQEQYAKAEKMMSEFKASQARKIPAVPTFEDKENVISHKAKVEETGKDGKPLQPLHNIYDRREKLLARLLNHRTAA